jgi:phospholipase/carboxylesterase
MALHGGSGHGRDFLFSWLREARTRGCVLVAPTSPLRTWSFPGLTDPDAGASGDADAEMLFALVERLRELLPIDASRMLLTGMSDGGTYTLMTGLRDASPFTALAPFSCVLAPDVLMDGRIARARDLPIRWVHGTLDWMFPPERAQEGVLALEVAGAKLEYVELEDLSHCHAREECARVLDWFGVPQP